MGSSASSDNFGKEPKNDKPLAEGDEELKKNIDRPLTESVDSPSMRLETNDKPLTEGDGNSNEGLEKNLTNSDDNSNEGPKKDDDNSNRGLGKNDEPLTEDGDNLNKELQEDDNKPSTEVNNEEFEKNEPLKKGGNNSNKELEKDDNKPSIEVNNEELEKTDKPLTEDDDNLSKELQKDDDKPFTEVDNEELKKTDKLLTEGDDNSNKEPRKDDNKPSTEIDDNEEPEKNDEPLTEGDDNSNEEPQKDDNKPFTVDNKEPEKIDNPSTEVDDNSNEELDKPSVEVDDNSNEELGINCKPLTEANPNEELEKSGEPLTECNDNSNERLKSNTPLTEGDTLTESNNNSLTEGENNFRKVYEELRHACSILRELYDSEEPNIRPITILSETINHAKVYSERIRPIASTTIKSIKGYTESYMEAEFVQFKDYFSDFIIEARDRNKEVEYVLKLHEEILTDLKRDWNALALIQPLESPVGNKFQTDRDVEKSISKSNKELPHLVDRLIGALSYILGFFYTLESDLSHLATSGGKPAPLTFKRLKKKAAKIIEGCDAYMSFVAGRSNPQLISDDSVKQWLSMKKVSTEDQQKSLLELGEETFSGSVKVLGLLGTCAA